MRRCLFALVVVFCFATGANAQGFGSILWVNNTFGTAESQAECYIDPPGYPDGYQNFAGLLGGEEFKSSCALDFQNQRYFRLSRALTQPQFSAVFEGYIWSGQTNAQSQINLRWTAWGPTGFRWNIVVSSPEGVELQNLAYTCEGGPQPNSDFTLPILRLPLDSWRSGYRFTIGVTSVPVPEPASMLALLCGIGALPLLRRRKA